MKLFFLEKFHCYFVHLRTGKLKSLNFDFCVVNFDTKKSISFAKVSKSLAPNGF